ncbi:MAG: hypothetical protein M3Q23_05090 [Actinomycetota bacterium]|nr:hypothetical protein [Actinomycetota bacterium]
MYARDGPGLFDRNTANVAVELRDQRDGRRLERRPVLLEFVPGSEDPDEYAIMAFFSDDCTMDLPRGPDPLRSTLRGQGRGPRRQE